MSLLVPNTVQDIELYILTETYFWFYSFSQEWLFNKTLYGTQRIWSKTS